MKKFILLGIVCLGTAQWGFSQNDPTIDAMYLSDSDPFCYNGSPKTLTVVVTDLDGDFVMVDPPAAVNFYLEVMNGTSNTVGNTTTFEFPVNINYGTPPPAGILSLEDISASAYSSGGIDPTGLDFQTLSGVEVNGQIAVDFTVPIAEMCNTGNPVDLNQFVVTPGGTFNYPIDPAYTQFSNSPALNVQTAFNVYINNDYTFDFSYEITDVNGCSAYSNLSVTFNEAPTVVVSTIPSTCTNANGQATAEITGFYYPYDVYWSTGFSENTSGSSTISNLSSGVYYANITDANGCKAVGKANVSDTDISVVESKTAPKCAGQLGSVTLSITPTTGSVSSVYWSNGTSGNVISSGPGEYSVEIHTTANCNYFGTYTILDSILKVKLDGVYGNSNCATPDGGIDITTSGGTGGYTWDWKKNGVSVYSTEDIWGIDGGVYTCTVEDNDGCSLTWGKTVNTYNNVSLWVNEVVKPTCGNANGSIDVFVDGTFDTPTIYSWSNSAVTEDLTGLPAGSYTLTYADQAGCVSYLTVKLENEKPYQPTICLLTVDDVLEYNMVVWEKDITQDVSGFNIYRETSQFGVFEKVAVRPYALESIFQDNDASPMDRSWRYYMTTSDECGGESYPSFVHKTIHVVASTSDGTNYDLHWDNYEGIAYTTIDLHRYDATNGWTIIANLPYGTNTYTEAPPVIAGLDYQVTFNLADPCTSTKVQDHNSSRSNKSASVFMPGGSTAQIQDNELGYISIYPNPASELITLHVDNPELFQNYEVRDLNGRLVSSGTIFSNNTNIPVDELAPGMYTIQLYADNKIIVEKFIKN